MAKPKSRFVCQSCGYSSPRWMGKCPECEEWNSFVEERAEVAPKGKGSRRLVESSSGATPVSQVETGREERFSTEIKELDRVLGGGIVSDSLVLVGGEPGIGKSTLLLQVAGAVAGQRGVVLYVSGEESPRQIKMRAKRLNIDAANLYVEGSTNLTEVERSLDKLEPVMLVVDSIQTMSLPDIDSSLGSVSQIRESTAVLLQWAKSRGIAVFIIGHVTKQGRVAGPKMLEHMVDTVLYFEGERYNAYRLLRAVKNRYGSTDEVGVFEMESSGLTEVLNPSAAFLSQRPEAVPGSVVAPCLEGTRCVLVEIQSLISKTNLNLPRRMATGIDHKRLPLIMAILERHLGLKLYDKDAYVKVVGGLYTEEPAADLALAMSLVSGYENKAVPYDVCVMGEVGLTGEVRSIAMLGQRLKEAKKLGFRRAVVPAHNRLTATDIKGIELLEATTVGEAWSKLSKTAD